MDTCEKCGSYNITYRDEGIPSCNECGDNILEDVIGSFGRIADHPSPPLEDEKEDE